MLFSKHTVGVERITDEIRKFAPQIPRGNSCAVVERYEGAIVKICYVGNLRGYGLRALNTVASQYASAYGARFSPVEASQVRKGKRNAS